MTQALTLRNSRLPVSLGNFDALVSYANAHPMIEEEEERELANRLRYKNDLDAAHQLVLSHLRLVIKIARSFKGYGLPLNDVAQEGAVGLMKAVRRFDPDMGVRLSSFASHWIRAEIYEYVLKNWRIVKIATTKAQRKLFFRLREAKQSLKWLTHQEVEAVAEELNVPVKEVKTMERRLYIPDLAFEAEDNSQDLDTDQSISPVVYLHADDSDPETTYQQQKDAQVYRRMLSHSLSVLDERQQDIIQRRWLDNDKTALADLAEFYGVSIERIRQIEVQAIDKLKHTMTQTFVA